MCECACMCVHVCVCVCVCVCACVCVCESALEAVFQIENTREGEHRGLASTVPLTQNYVCGSVEVCM